jgi:hypothetical protein
MLLSKLHNAAHKPETSRALEKPLVRVRKSDSKTAFDFGNFCN